MVLQYCTTTLPEAISQYQNGDLTAKGLLHYYIKIRLKAGWILRESQKEISQKLGISKAAFYSGLSRLKAEGSINWSVPANTKIAITLSSKSVDEHDEQSTIMDKQSTIVDCQSASVDSQSIIIETQSANMDYQSASVDSQSVNMDNVSYIVTKENLEPKQGKDFAKPPSSSSSSSSTYLSTFISSLSSDEERERFERFCLEAASCMPTQPTLISRWKEKNAETLVQEYKLRVIDQKVVIKDELYEVNYDGGKNSANSPAEEIPSETEEIISW